MTVYPDLTEGYRRSVLLRAHDFFRYPIDYLDRSWLENRFESDALDRVGRQAGARRPLSDWLLDHFGLVACINYDFEEAHSRLVLLDPVSLQQLLELAGVLVYADAIPKQPEEVAIAPGLHRFLVSKAPFLVGSPPSYCIPLIVTGWSDTDLVNKCLLEAGVNLLAVALHGLPFSVTERLALKLPRELGELWREKLAREMTDSRIAEARRLLLKLYREVDPSCSLLCN